MVLFECLMLHATMPTGSITLIGATQLQTPLPLDRDVRVTTAVWPVASEAENKNGLNTSPCVRVL